MALPAADRDGALPPWRGVFVAVPSVAAAVRLALARPSSCVPTGAVVTTYFSEQHAALQSLTLSRLQHRTCFMARVVTVCYQHGQSAAQPDAGGRECVHAPPIPVGPIGLQAFDLRRQATYHELIWVKWRILHEALQDATEVLFLDSDTVLFRNPFHALRREPHYDLRFQSERACAPASSCEVSASCHVNGGVLLARRSLTPFIEKLIGHEPRFEVMQRTLRKSTAALDQDVVTSLLQLGRGQPTSCPLPSTHFVGFCSWQSGYARGNRSFFDNLRPCDLVSYHAHCLIATKDKLLSIQRMLNKTAHCPQAGGTGSARFAERRWPERLGPWGPIEPPVLRRQALRNTRPGRGTRAG